MAFAMKIVKARGRFADEDEKRVLVGGVRVGSVYRCGNHWTAMSDEEGVGVGHARTRRRAAFWLAEQAGFKPEDIDHYGVYEADVLQGSIRHNQYGQWEAMRPGGEGIAWFGSKVAAWEAVLEAAA